MSGQDISGSWSLLGNGYKWEIYLKQEGTRLRGWLGVDGVNLDGDVITGSVKGNEINFTRSNPLLPRPQEWRGFLSVHNNPAIDVRRRATGGDTMAGIGNHMGVWNFSWSATRIGPYREESAPAVSRTSAPALPSLFGAWTSGGKPTSITQDGSGNLVFVNEYGMRSTGTFADSAAVVASEWEGGLRGSLQDGGRTIRWANGTVWYRAATAVGSRPAALPSLGGAWTSGGKPTSITQDGSGNLVFVNEYGMRSTGTFADSAAVVASEWEGGLRGSLQDSGRTIRWANGTVWYRAGQR